MIRQLLRKLLRPCTHAGVRPLSHRYGWQCTGCGKTFPTKVSWREERR